MSKWWIGTAIGVCAGAALAAPPDWSKVPARKMTLFFPGQSGYEWVMNKPDHSAVPDIVDKKRGCSRCHEGDAAEIGDKIVAGKPVGSSKAVLEPSPPKGKPGSVPVSFQAAYDGQKIYFRFEWTPPANVAEKKMDPKNEVKLTMMFDGGSTVDGASLNGCWSTCHMDLRTMPDAVDAAKGHAKAKALGWDEGATKYIAESRSAMAMAKPRGGWDKLKADAEVDALLKAGKFYDLMQFSSGKGEKPVDGYVLDSRHMDGGKSLVKAEGKKDGNKWIVTFERTLAGAGKGDHTIAPDKVYNFGFALHEDYSGARFHYVSLGYQFGLDKEQKDIKNYVNVTKQ